MSRTRHSRRTRPARTLAGLAVLCSLAALPAAARADSRPSTVRMAYDLLIERPIGLAETLVGLGIAGVAYPLSLASGNQDAVIDRCITTPARYTFDRPLGDFSRSARSLCSPIGFGWGLAGMSLALVKRPLDYVFGRSPFDDRPGPGEDELEI